MSDADPNDEPEQDEELPLVAAGLDPREVAQVARLTDVLNRHGVAVYNFGGITPTDYGVAFDTTLYIQTREVPEDVEPPEEVETERAADAGEVEVDEDVVVEETEAADEDE